MGVSAMIVSSVWFHWFLIFYKSVVLNLRISGCRPSLDRRHRVRHRAAQSAINHQPISRGGEHRLRRRFAVNVPREDRLKDIRVILVGNRVDLSLEIFLCFLGAELGSLLAFPALHQAAAINDGVVIASLENMGINQPFEPWFFSCAIEPR